VYWAQGTVYLSGAVYWVRVCVQSFSSQCAPSALSLCLLLTLENVELAGDVFSDGYFAAFCDSLSFK